MEALNFADSIDYFLDRHAKERLIAKGYISEYTQENYAGHLRRLGRYVSESICKTKHPKNWSKKNADERKEDVDIQFEKIEILDITRDLVEDYLVERSKSNKKPTTLNAELYCYRSYFKLLSKRFSNIENILDGLERARFKRTESKHLVENHVERLLDYLLNLDRTDPYQSRNGIFLDVLIKTGCRISECLNLKLESIVYREEMIACVFFGKGGKVREVPLPYHLDGKVINNNIIFKENINEYIELHRKHFLKGKDSPHLLLSNRGNRWSDDQARIMFNSVMATLDLTTYNYTPHSLRHSVATHLLYKGVPEREVATILGHASPTVTNQIYSHTEGSKIQRGMTFGF
ncbi:MAG: hypothetical protein COA79_24350 [Planctomycetota bacterium]|nr:MAG: hypothetical protein COA79_24350 [Planctomycetota bacterium]